MILVSACLLGIDCKYTGGNNENKKLKEFLKDKEYVLVCPEQLGGLTTPRLPSEIIEGDGKDVLVGMGKVVNKSNIDVTEEFVKGAKETLKIADLYKAKTAILKSRSPSCGSEHIYSGEFNGKLKSGQGVTASLLKEKGILVVNEENFSEVLGLNKQ